MNGFCVCMKKCENVYNCKIIRTTLEDTYVNKKK